MSMEVLEVVERIEVVQLARLNQAHVQIADRGAVVRLMEQRTLAMNDGFFQSSFADKCSFFVAASMT